MQRKETVRLVVFSSKPVALDFSISKIELLFFFFFQMSLFYFRDLFRQDIFTYC